MDKPKFPEPRPTVDINLKVKLIEDFDKYSTGSMLITQDGGDVSVNGEKIGSAVNVVGGGASISIGSRRYLISLKDIFEAVYEAEKMATVKYIETRPATHSEIVRHYGLGARLCIHCGKPYAPGKVPTAEQRCFGCAR